MSMAELKHGYLTPDAEDEKVKIGKVQRTNDDRMPDNVRQAELMITDDTPHEK